MAPPVLRPLGIGEIFDVAINIYRRHALTLIRLVLFVVAPVNALSVLVQASAPNESSFHIDENTGEFTFHDNGFWTQVVAASVTTLLAFLATTLASGACFKAIADAYLGEEPRWRLSLKFALSRLHSIIWVTFLAAFLAGLAVVLLVVGAIYFWIGFSVAIPVLLTEGVKGRKALGRSRWLVGGRWWPVFAVVALGQLLTSIVSGGLGALVGGLTFVEGGSDSFASSAADFVSGTVASVLTVPFTAAFVIVLYFDLRVRKEAFDLQLLAQQLGVDPPAGGGIAPTMDPDMGRSDSSAPPFWPPPPGWKPTPPDESAS